jgi:hypothetical protein
MEKVKKMIDEGHVVLVGEVRGAKAEVVRYVSKRTGQKEAFVKVTYVAELPGSAVPVLVEQVVSDQELDPSTVKIATVKGKWYAFALASLSFERGTGKARMLPLSEPVAL